MLFNLIFQTSEQFFRNPHKNAVFLMLTTFISDQGLGFGKLQTDLYTFSSDFTRYRWNRKYSNHF